MIDLLSAPDAEVKSHITLSPRTGNVPWVGECFAAINSVRLLEIHASRKVLGTWTPQMDPHVK